MEILYNQRQVNSVYFDTLDLKMFSESEEGCLPRKKIRARWYNDSKEFSLETKISSVEGRFKTSKIWSSISSEESLFNTSYFDQRYGRIRPTLKITYSRSYFLYKNMRITFDENICYLNLNPKRKHVYIDPEVVAEIKVPIGCADDYIEKFIPYPNARFSKYSRGLLMCASYLEKV